MIPVAENAKRLLALLDERGLTLPRYVLERERESSGRGEEEIRAEVRRRALVTRSALERGLAEDLHSRSGMTTGFARAFASAETAILRDPLVSKAIAYALAISEVNACGGRIVAFPTAGSCGIVPGVIWAWRDAREPGLPTDHARVQDAFLAASAIGSLVAARATLAGAAGGCQAECGTAGAMAAAALSWLVSGCPSRAIEAAALALKNSLGLACDPVGGLVEVPCVKRNAFLAAHAVVAASLAESGIRSFIPFDEVVGAMKSIGDAMPSDLKETSRGGLAATPTALAFGKGESGNP